MKPLVLNTKIALLYLAYMSLPILDANEADANVLLSFKQQLLQSSAAASLLRSWNSTSKSILCTWKGITCNAQGSVSRVNLGGYKLGPELSTISITAFFDLKSLETLNLSTNSFHGPIPQLFSSCTSLVALDLSNNFFEGSLNPSLSNCSRLKQLNLSYNTLMGNIPSEFGALYSIENFNMRSNQFTGSIPSTLGQLKQLKFLDLGQNQLDGEIPSSIGNSTELTQLNLDENKLAGSIPVELGNLRSLQILNFNKNDLTGIIPTSLANCSELVYLFAYDNRLSGQIPPEFGRLKRIETLWFDMNCLSGPIPPSLSNCSALSRILFYSNNLTGGIPPELGHLKNMFTLELSENDLSGKITLELGNFKNLSYLSFEGNNLHGEIPISFTNCTKLIRIAFSYNMFQGTIPQGIGQLKNLASVELAYNQLTGKIPPGLGNLTHQLQGVFLQDNMLEGEIPSQISSCKTLVNLDLSTNKLSGAIPTSFCDLTWLQKFNISHNLLTDNIPNCWGNWYRLQLLDFSFNRLTGTIPQSIRGLANIALVFSLSSNMLQGTIPEGIGSMTMVQRIDLSRNNLEGEIPSAIGMCTELQALDLSLNNLSGSIPTMLGKLVFLNATLNLSHNRLQGHIPKILQNLKDLTALDLSNNWLTGNIPNFLTSMPALKFLNLSNNLLEGAIPNSGIFLNLPATSFTGNPKLCGPKISKACSRKAGRKRAIAISCPIAALLLMAMGFWIFLRQKLPTELVSSFNFLPLIQEFSISELLKATNDYHSGNIIGEGAESIVYKGTLSNGQIVAVKKFKNRNHRVFDTFIKELRILANIRHRNLIHILGYCRNRSIVLEFMPNGSLEENLQTLNWKIRLQIATDVAQGLAYLHHGCAMSVVHRDLKPSNILLGEDFGARLADFGISKLLETPPNAAASSDLLIHGTPGYMPPEYCYTTTPSRTGDVYSYGVILLELVTGQPPTSGRFGEEHTLPSWVASIYPSHVLDAVDSTLLPAINNHDLQQLLLIIKLALWCTHSNYSNRPQMSEVVQFLSHVCNPFKSVLFLLPVDIIPPR